MAFLHVSAPAGMRTDKLLSADNVVPERHLVIEMLRNAASVLGLNASVIATLEAMLSCLPPRRTHHTVFASNATLTFRRNGISDRTLRRHAAILHEAGLLVRKDSPNGKRFSRYSSTENKALRFGFDLSPLFARLEEIATHAAEAVREQEEIAYMRCKVRAIAQDILRSHPADPAAIATLKLLRRKLARTDYDELFARLSAVHNSGCSAEAPNETTPQVSARDGQNVRHHHKSNKELNDKEAREETNTHTQLSTPPTQVVTIPELLAACPEAAQFSLRKVESLNDVILHARTLAPMMGIDRNNYEAAQNRLGSVRTAMTIWALMQFHNRIQKVGAYFRAITSGTKSAEFKPEELIRRLARAQAFQIASSEVVRGQPCSP